MEQHIRIVGILCIGLSLFGMLLGVLAFVFLSGLGYVVGDEASFILPTIGIIAGVFFLVISIPGIIGGLGLLQKKEWARILVLIIAACHLLNFPIGTAVGAYSIWVLVQDETVRIFNPVLPQP